MRKGLSVLLIASLAVGAPVPKPKPTMAEIYGEPTTDEKACIAEMKRNGALTLKLPTTAAAEHPANVITRGPQIARNLDGDFTLTTRLTLDLPKTANTTHRGFPPGAAAGLCVCVENGRGGTDQCAAIMIGKNDVGRERWSYFEYHYWGKRGGGSMAGNAKDIKDEAPIYLRVTCKGDEVTTAYGSDGKTWQETGKPRGRVGESRARRMWLCGRGVRGVVRRVRVKGAGEVMSENVV